MLDFIYVGIYSVYFGVSEISMSKVKSAKLRICYSNALWRASRAIVKYLRGIPFTDFLNTQVVYRKQG